VVGGVVLGGFVVDGVGSVVAGAVEVGGRVVVGTIVVAAGPVVVAAVVEVSAASSSPPQADAASSSPNTTPVLRARTTNSFFRPHPSFAGSVAVDQCRTSLTAFSAGLDVRPQAVAASMAMAPAGNVVTGGPTPVANRGTAAADRTDGEVVRTGVVLHGITEVTTSST
jgi:hypothetical protein